MAERTGEQPEAIRAHIRETRAELGETLGAIQDRLRPQSLKEQLKEKVQDKVQEARDSVRDATIGRAQHMMNNARESVSDAGHGILDTIRDNPIPAAIAAVGLGWLLVNARSSDSGRQVRASEQWVRPNGEQWDEQEGGLFHRMGDKADDVGGSIKETAGTVAERVQEVGGTIADRTQHAADAAKQRVEEIAGEAGVQARRIEQRVERTLDESPLAIGAVAVALGLATGFAIPETLREQQARAGAK